METGLYTRGILLIGHTKPLGRSGYNPDIALAFPDELVPDDRDKEFSLWIGPFLLQEFGEYLSDIVENGRIETPEIHRDLGIERHHKLLTPFLIGDLVSVPVDLCPLRDRHQVARGVYLAN